MKKNKVMRFASAIMVMTLLSTCVVGGTFAKYTSGAEGSDQARVAYWGFGMDNDLVISDLFAASYTNVGSVGGDVIAPGTSGEATFAFAYTNNTAELSGTTIEAPEVAYDFDVVVTENCDALIQANKNIKWYLDDKTTALTWAQLVEEIDALGENTEGGSRYAANTLPDDFGVGTSHTIYWEWLIDGGAQTYDIPGQTGVNQNAYDTYMANRADLDDVSITITITATQVD